MCPSEGGHAHVYVICVCEVWMSLSSYTHDIVEAHMCPHILMTDTQVHLCVHLITGRFSL